MEPAGKYIPRSLIECGQQNVAALGPPREAFETAAERWALAFKARHYTENEAERAVNAATTAAQEELQAWSDLEIAAGRKLPEPQNGATVMPAPVMPAGYGQAIGRAR